MGDLARNTMSELGQLGIEGWLRMHSADPEDWAAAADGWRRLGADMVMLYPMRSESGRERLLTAHSVVRGAARTDLPP